MSSSQESHHKSSQQSQQRAKQCRDQRDKDNYNVQTGRADLTTFYRAFGVYVANLENDSESHSMEAIRAALYKHKSSFSLLESEIDTIMNSYDKLQENVEV